MHIEFILYAKKLRDLSCWRIHFRLKGIQENFNGKVLIRGRP